MPYIDIQQCILIYLIKNVQYIGIVLESVSNQEWSLFIWMCIILIVILYKNKKIRKNISEILYLSLQKYIIILIVVHVIYTIAIVCVLERIEYWDMLFLKDTFFWFLASLYLLRKVTTVNDFTFFKTEVIKAVQISGFLSYFFTLYSFSLGVELIIVPLILICILIKAYVDVMDVHKNVGTFVNKILHKIYFIIVLFAIYKLTTNWDDVFKLATIRQLFLLPLLTVLYLPIFYILCLWANYIDIMKCIDYVMRSSSHKNHKRLLKQYIIAQSHFDIRRIYNIRKGLKWFKVPTKSQIRDLAQLYVFDKVNVGDSFDI